MAQNPLIVKTVGGTVLEPDDKDQEIWQNNEWNGKFFYQGKGTPLKLCVTDGTSTGTVLLKEINADYFQYTIPAQNFIYIITERSSGTYPNQLNNVEIWKSDGTATGTVMVKALPPFNPFNFSAGVRWTSDKGLKRNFSVVGDVMYFMGWDATNGSELWRTDGTETGTYMVKDIRPGTAGSSVSSFCAIGNYVYFFAAAVNLEQKLWKTDGTAAGTVQVAVPEPFFAVPHVGKVGNKMVFFANNTVNGIEPWVSDGTPAGTYMLADVNPGSGNGTPGSEQNVHLRFNDKYCFFMGNKTSGGKSLWRTDGTPTGTIQLTADGLVAEENFSGGGYSDIDNNFLYWIGGNQKLYRSDGTVVGTKRITTGLSNAQYLKIYKGGAWFHARNADNLSNGEPYRSDGMAVNTKRLEVQPGETPSYPYGFFVLNNKLHFFSDSYAGRHLYRYNGDMTFNGSVAESRWSDAANWNSMLTPGITDTVYINSGLTVNVNGANAFAGTVVMQVGSTINLVSPADSLFVQKELQGTSVGGNGTLVLRSFTNDTVSVFNPLTANNLAAGGAVSLKNNLTVAGNLTLSGNARLLLNDASLRLTGSTSVINGDASNYVVTNGAGNLSIEAIGSGGRTGSVVFPIGTLENYNPVAVTNSGTSDVFSARVRQGISNVYTGENATGGAYTGGAVNATWFINEATAGGSNATLFFQWNAAQELPAFDRTQSRVGHYTGGGWQLGTAGAAGGSNPYSFTGTGFTSFSPFGVMNSGAVLPLVKINLSVLPSANGNLLSWSLIGDGVQSVKLERSANGKLFMPVYTAAGTAPGTYDDHHHVAEKTFYRLRAIHQNGAIHYSPIVWVNSGGGGSVQVYPTVFAQSVFVQNNRSVTAELTVYSTLGHLVLRRQLSRGTNEISFAGLPAGAYLYKVADGVQSVKSGHLFKQ